jgi:hypothetical protein
MFNRRREINERKDTEKRQFNFSREQNAVASLASPQDDMVFLQQKEERSDLLKWQQDLKEELVQLKHDLRNEQLNEEKGKWEPIAIAVGYNEQGQLLYQMLPPIINELGIRMIDQQVRPLFSRNMINTNLNEEIINKVLCLTCNTIVENMADNYDRYGVEFTNMDLVMRLIKNAIIPAPFRALNDGERRHARSINKRVEAFTETTDTGQKRSRLGGLL